MTDEYPKWVDSIREKAVGYEIIFIHLGAAQSPARKRLLESIDGNVDVLSYLSEDATSTQRVRIIDSVERLSNPDSWANLGVLRERVHADVAQGTSVILLSRAPRVAYADVPGSSLLDDARFVSGPRGGYTSFEEWPACVDEALLPTDVLRQALAELGPEVCASLDRLIFEAALSGDEVLSAFTARELEALDGACLTNCVTRRRQWCFPIRLSPLREALGDVISDFVEPLPNLGDVNAAVWEIERRIRRAVRATAVARFGDSWKQQLMSKDLNERVLSRANESAYPGAVSIKSIRDPLEWVTFGELLDIRRQDIIGDLNMSVVLWRGFENELVPIRNRLAHMRTLRPEDRSTALKWRNVVRTRVK